MKLLKGLVCVGLVASAMSFADENLMEDKRDGKVYHKVDMGSNVWLAENLNFNSPHSYCYGNEASCDENGRLYTWEDAAMACPYGWRLPTDSEWLELLESQGEWNGLKSLGLQLPMAGDRRADGVYHYQGESAFFWTETLEGKKHVRYKFDVNKPNYDRSPMVDGPAYSVKCVLGEKSCFKPLMNAVRAGNIDKVKALIAAGADVDARCDGGEISPLGLAIDKRNLEMVRLLLDKGADANAVDVTGPSDEQLSMLTRAFSKNDFEVVNLLLDHSAIIRACDVVLSDWENKEKLLFYVLERMSVRNLNTCLLDAYSLLEVFADNKVVYKKLKSLGAKSGEEACANIVFDKNTGWPKPGSNWAMCGD